MKISRKITLVTFLSIIGLILLFITINTLFSYRFYLHTRKLELNSVVEEIVRNRYDSEVIEKLESKLNIDIEVKNPPMDDDRRRQNLLLPPANIGINMNPDPLNGSRMNKTGNSRKINDIVEDVKVIDTNLAVNFMYKLKDNFIKISISKISVLQTIKSTNKFIFITGLFMSLIGLILSMLLSRLITKPILKLNSAVEKIANLDFTEKLDIKGNDEITALSKNVNLLNSELKYNIGNLKDSNQKLQEVYDFERKENQKREEFIGALTHEIKTPITIINTYLEYLSSQEVADDERKEFSEIVIQEGNDLSKILDRLIQYIKKEDNSLEVLDLTKFNYTELIESRIRKFQLDFTEKNINVIKNIPISTYILADYEKMTHVLDNIFSNAVAHADENGKVSIKVVKLQNTVVTEIYNSGPPIKKENIEKIWDSFYKEDESRNRKYGGIGLGLAFVKNILNAHKSEFGVKNVDKGVLFWYSNTKE